LVQRDPERRYSAIQALSHPWITGKTDAELPLTPRENVEAGKTRLKLKISLVALSILTHLQYSGKNDLQPEQTTRGSSASKKLSSPSKLRVQNDPAPKFRLLRRSIVKEKPVGPEKVLLIRSRAYNTKGSHPHSTSLQGQLRDDNALKAPKSRNSEKLHDTPTKVLVSKALSGSFKEESQQKCHQHDSEERVSVPAFTSTYFSKCKTVSHQCILEAMSKPRLSKDHTVKNATDSALEKLFPVISKLQPDQAPSPDSFQSKGCLTFKVDHKKSRFETHRNTEVGRSLPTLGLTKLP
jgi:hypothetical protein